MMVHGIGSFICMSSRYFVSYSGDGSWGGEGYDALIFQVGRKHMFLPPQNLLSMQVAGEFVLSPCHG